MPVMDLVKTFQFESAHTTPGANGAPRLHGHSYTLDLVVEGSIDPKLGWVMDYSDISAAFQPIYVELDHQTLDQLDGISEPTLPNLEKWVFEQTKTVLPNLKSVHLRIESQPGFNPELVQGGNSAPLPDRIRFGFEAAHSLPELPPDHKCHTLHGHSFVAEVASESLESLADDLGELHEQLDHRCLNEIEGLENPTSENLAIWIWNQLYSSRDDLTAVLVAETCTSRCIYHGR